MSQIRPFIHICTKSYHVLVRGVCTVAFCVILLTNQANQQTDLGRGNRIHFINVHGKFTFANKHWWKVPENLLFQKARFQQSDRQRCVRRPKMHKKRYILTHTHVPVNSLQISQIHWAQVIHTIRQSHVLGHKAVFNEHDETYSQISWENEALTPQKTCLWACDLINRLIKQLWISRVTPIKPFTCH